MKIFAPFIIGIGLLGGTVASATTNIDLGSAAGFAVLAGSTVTSSGLTKITGDVGVSSGRAVTGFGPGIVTGTIHAADPAAATAQGDLQTAYGVAVARTGGQVLATPQLGGVTFLPGAYSVAAAALLDGTITLDGQGDGNAVFLFQIGSALTTGTGAGVVFVNGARANNLFFQVGSSATLGNDTAFAGNILALTSITLESGARIDGGRALALNGAVTMIGNSIALPAVPEPATWAIMATGFGLVGGAMRRRQSQRRVSALA